MYFSITSVLPMIHVGIPTFEEKLTFYSNLVREREARRLVVKSSTCNLLTTILKTRLTPRLEEVEKSGVKMSDDMG